MQIPIGTGLGVRMNKCILLARHNRKNAVWKPLVIQLKVMFDNKAFD